VHVALLGAMVEIRLNLVPMVLSSSLRAPLHSATASTGPGVPTVRMTGPEPDLDAQFAALRQTLACGLAEGELVAQIPRGRLAALRRNLQSGRPSANIDAGTFDVR
jgi:hypothetical protein